MVLLLGGVLLFDDGGMLRQHHFVRLPEVGRLHIAGRRVHLTGAIRSYCGLRR
jgi:hypothetical protein